MQLPAVSGKSSAAALGACLALSAVLFPVASRLPVWVEAEVVVGIWWAIWVVALTSLLVRGRRVSDDHQLGASRSWGMPDLSSVGSVGDPGCVSIIDVEGCLIVLTAIAAVFLLVGAAWLLVELVVPLVAFVLYAVLRGMLAHAVNDRHACEGDLPRSTFWGTLWASVYTAPIALLVYLAHSLAR